MGAGVHQVPEAPSAEFDDTAPFREIVSGRFNLLSAGGVAP